jgi:hypothetical protein
MQSTERGERVSTLEEPIPEPEPEIGTETPEEIDTDEEPDLTAGQAAEQLGSDEIMKKAGQANERYHKAIVRLLGEDPNRHECPTCEGLGVVWGDIAAGEIAAPDFIQGDDAEPCAYCNAWGVVITGSKHPDQQTKPCTHCGGRGWNTKVQPPAVVTPIAPQAQAMPPAGQGGTWVPGRGFIPYGQAEPIVADPSVA